MLGDVDCRGTSRIRKPPPPYDHPRTLGIVLTSVLFRLRKSEESEGLRLRKSRGS